MAGLMVSGIWNRKNGMSSGVMERVLGAGSWNKCTKMLVPLDNFNSYGYEVSEREQQRRFQLAGTFTIRHMGCTDFATRVGILA